MRGGRSRAGRGARRAGGARLGEDLQHLVVREEEEAREGLPLDVQVRVEAALHALEGRAAAAQLVEHCGRRVAEHRRVGDHAPHQVAPHLRWLKDRKSVVFGPA